MADQHVVAPGAHYSGQNKVPTVQKFLQSLDKGKAERDKKIDEDRVQNNKSEVPEAHKVAPRGQNQKTVTDPTTGKQVVIEDATKEMYTHVTDPKLSVPNANLGKPTVGSIAR